MRASTRPLSAGEKDQAQGQEVNPRLLALVLVVVVASLRPRAAALAVALPVIPP